MSERVDREGAGMHGSNREGREGAGGLTGGRELRVAESVKMQGGVGTRWGQP